MKKYLMLLVVIVIGGFASAQSVTQSDNDVRDRISHYKADKSIDFANWPKDGELILHTPDLSNIVTRVSEQAMFLQDEEVSEVNGHPCRRSIYRAWRSGDNDTEELAVRVSVMDSVDQAHEYLLSRWANVAMPSLKRVRGADVGLDVGDVCFAIPNASGELQVIWFIKANVVVEIRGSGTFINKISDLARSVERNIYK